MITEKEFNKLINEGQYIIMFKDGRIKPLKLKSIVTEDGKIINIDNIKEIKTPVFTS